MFELLVCDAICISLQFLILVEMGLFKEALDNFSLIPIFFLNWDFYTLRRIYLCKEYMLIFTCKFNSITKI